MADHHFPDRAWLKSIVQKAVGALSDVSWDYEPTNFQGFSGLGVDGDPLPGMPLAPPALTAQASGGATQVTLSIPSWVGHGNDCVTRSLVMGPWTLAGPTPPTIVIAGDVDTEKVKRLDIRVTLAGARGVWEGEYSLDRGVTWVPFTSAATVTLGTSGLELQISTGNASLTNTWRSNPAQSLLNSGLRHFTLSIKCESESDAHSILERVSTYFNLKSTISQLPSHFMALRDVSEVVNLPNVEWDGRAIRAAVLEVFLTYLTEQVDTEGETGSEFPNNWIETVLPPTSELTD